MMLGKSTYALNSMHTAPMRPYSEWPAFCPSHEIGLNQTNRGTAQMRRPASASQQDLEQKLHRLAERITEQLQTVWKDPSGLIFDLRIVAANAGTYSVINGCG